MKSLTVILFSMIILPLMVSAQESDFTDDLLSLLKAKHDFEKHERISVEEAAPYKEVYVGLYAVIKKNKGRYISFINDVAKSEVEFLSSRYTEYNYIDPLQSYIEPRNLITYMTYFEIVKLSLEEGFPILPPLDKVPFKTESIITKGR